MTDVDALAHFDPHTGSPIFDNRTAATRWLDALDDVPEDLRRETQSLCTNSGPVGAGKNTKQKTSVPDQRSNKNNKINMSTNNDYGLLEASEVNLEIIERLLLEHGFEAEIDSTWIQVKMPLFGVFINVMDSIPLLDLAGAISLRGDVTLEETLRFINQLNNRIAGVGFSLWEPIDEAMTDRGLIDLGDLWASIALPIGSGFSARQFIATFELLIGALDHAFGAAVEAGLVDPEESASHPKEAFCHGR